MPIHDWTRVRANRFHDFHQHWTIALRVALNEGRLPPGYFAMIEQKAGLSEPDAIILELTRTEAADYARKANRITVRHSDDKLLVGVIEIVSPGNKESHHAIRAFVQQAVAFIQAGVYLLIVDLFPPSQDDPQGIHKVIWDHLHDEQCALPAGKPLTVVAYAAGTKTAAYVAPVAIGDALPNMPILLTPDWCVACPLEATYQTAWAWFPAPLKGPLESPPAP